MASANLTPDAEAPARHALRTAAATTLCLVVGEWCQVKHTNLAVWTTYMVMAQHPFSSFQKGVERIIGRALGILAGLAISTCFEGAILLGQGAVALVLIACFYIYFSDRLAYTFLNAGLYAVVLFRLGIADPATAAWQGEDMFAAIVVGVVVADLVTWLAGAERDLHINLGAAPLWPLREEWLNQSLMLTVTVLVAVRVADGLDLPVENSAISVMFLTVTPDIQSLIQKGELRIAGALMASGYAILTFFVLGFVPYFPLLAGLLFFGQFLAAYIARAGGTFAYSGLQMGLVLPMLVVASPSDLGSLAGAIERLEGILVALAASLLVGGLWPRFPFRKQA